MISSKMRFFIGICCFILLVACSKKTKPEVAQHQIIQKPTSALDDPIWTDVDYASVKIIGRQNPLPSKFRTLKLDTKKMHALLERTVSIDGSKPFEIISVPNPDGGADNYKIFETLSIDRALLLKYPYLRTYGGKGTYNSTSTVKLDFMPNGFHAYIFTTKGSIIISPVSEGDTEYYLCYYKHNTGEIKQKFETDSIPSGNGN